MIQYIPKVIRQILQSNTDLGFGSAGPKSKDSFPLYVGRFYDDVSLRTRTIQKPKQHWMNPYNHNSTVGYL